MKITEGYERYLLHPLLEGAMQQTNAQRGALLADISGDVLELGIGAGTNLPYYQGKVRSLVGVEPSSALASACEERARSLSLPLEVVRADASRALPLPAQAFDAVVLTFVLCSVRDVPGVLAQLRRHLRPSGRLYLMEHTAAAGALGYTQRALRPLWRRAVGGCDLRLSLRSALVEAGFSLDGLSAAVFPMPWPVSVGELGCIHVRR